MLRSLLIYLSQASWARKVITHWGIAWRVASRFVAGERLEDAVSVVQELNSKGINVTLDRLGEHVTNTEEAAEATREIVTIIKTINEREIRANVSIKLTQIGLALGKQVCEENLEQILSAAREYDNFIRFDMEDSPWVDDTLNLYRQMREEYGFENLGVVTQSYLYRSEKDIQELAASGAHVRLCKGAYQEPPDIAHPEKDEVDKAYDRLLRMLMDSANSQGAPKLSPDGRFPPIPGIATHDEQRIEFAKNYARQVGLPQQAYEFQLLYGIRRELQEQLVAESYPVRVYVPFGSEWYPYFTRRLAERPANLWFFISNFFRK
jgi:proline dehydrogenase